jgi:hypothetical protein
MKPPLAALSAPSRHCGDGANSHTEERAVKAPPKNPARFAVAAAEERPSDRICFRSC